MPYCEDHRPLPERCSCVSRYANARTLQQRSSRQSLQVESSYLLCQRPTQLLAPLKVCRASQSVKARFVTKDGGPISNRNRLTLYPRVLRDTPRLTAIARVALTVRFKALAIFAAPRFSLAIVFNVRTSSFVQARLTTFFFLATFGSFL